MPNGLEDIGGGVKIYSPSPSSSNPIETATSILQLSNLRQQSANAPLERQKLEFETKSSEVGLALRANELLNLNVKNLLERANLQKSIGDETRAQAKFVIESYEKLPSIFAIDFNAGVDVLNQLNPDAVAVQNDDGTASITVPAKKTEVVDGVRRSVDSKETRRIIIDPSKVSAEKKLSLENEWYGRVNNNPDVKDFADVSSAYKDLVAVSKLATGKGDIALMQAFARINNPNANLREGQRATLENSGGLGNAFMNLWDKATTQEGPVFGTDPNSKERKDFINAAEKLYQNKRAQALSIGRNAADFAKSQGLNPRNILSPVGDITVKQFMRTDQELLDEVNNVLDKVP